MADKNYCIIDEQAKVYEGIYKTQFDLLYKTGTFDIQPVVKKPEAIIKFVYTGNIIYGRLETIIAIAKTLEQINCNGKKAELHIYTANTIEQKDIEFFQKTNSVQLMGKVSYNAIPKILNDADVLLHVESFEKHQKLATSLSFSTKLVDYFEAGKPIFAIGWENAASIKYLKNNSIGVTVNSPNDLTNEILSLIDSRDSFGAIGSALWQFGKEQHNTSVVLANFEEQLAKMTT
jgi:glycosyltransferase involved in cell wall biosynthesis